MKRTILIATVLFTLVSVGAFTADADFGALGAKGKTELSLEEMLTYAIQDEYLARSEYAEIMERYGAIRPFSNIIRAEERHILSLKEVFGAHGLTVPDDASGSLVALPPDLRSAFEIGVKAEIDNIAMYQSFLGGAAAHRLPEDVRTVFEQLAAASSNHLRAFKNNLSRYN